MAIYNYALFLHIIGALTLGVANAVTLLVFSGIRSASATTEMRFWGGLARRTRPLTTISAVVLLLSGVYMAFVAWGWTTPWIDISFALMVAMAVLGARLVGPRFGKVGAAIAQAGDGPVTPELRRLRDDQTLWIGVSASAALYLSIIFMMTVKPALLASLLTVLVALVLAAAVALTLRARLAGERGAAQTPTPASVSR